MSDNLEPVSGIVAVVQVGAGRGDVIGVALEKSLGQPVRLHSFDAVRGEVYCDGLRVSAVEFFAWFLAHDYPVKATLYPALSSYENAMKAEFTSGGGVA